jgi:hypothetical protein
MKNEKKKKKKKKEEEEEEEEEEDEGKNCDISGFRLLIVEAFTLLGRYAVNVDSWEPTFWDSLSVPFSGVKLSKRNAGNGWMLYAADGVGSDSLSGKDGTDSLSQNVGHGYQHKQRNVSEKRRPQEEASYNLLA